LKRFLHLLPVLCNVVQREITNLKRLCAEKGALEEEVAACKPRRRSTHFITLTVFLASLAFALRAIYILAISANFIYKNIENERFSCFMLNFCVYLHVSRATSVLHTCSN